MPRFDCPRTCARQEICRFQALWAAMGPTKVYSHTVRVAVDYGRSPDALQAAVLRMGGTWLGQGRHKLYEAAENGLGFTLPGWHYPVVLRADGSLASDDYQGQWGNPADLQTLAKGYALQAARAAAEAQGWMVEETEDGLRVYHPLGGSLTVAADGTVEAFGFDGVGCHDATTTLADAIGARREVVAKPEFFAERARIQC